MVHCQVAPANDAACSCPLYILPHIYIRHSITQHCYFPDAPSTGNTMSVPVKLKIGLVALAYFLAEGTAAMHEAGRETTRTRAFSTKDTYPSNITNDTAEDDAKKRKLRSLTINSVLHVPPLRNIQRNSTSIVEDAHNLEPEPVELDLDLDIDEEVTMERFDAPATLSVQLAEMLLSLAESDCEGSQYASGLELDENYEPHAKEDFDASTMLALAHLVASSATRSSVALRTAPIPALAASDRAPAVTFTQDPGRPCGNNVYKVDVDIPCDEIVTRGVLHALSVPVVVPGVQRSCVTDASEFRVCIEPLSTSSSLYYSPSRR